MLAAEMACMMVLRTEGTAMPWISSVSKIVNLSHLDAPQETYDTHSLRLDEKVIKVIAKHL